MSNTSNNTNVSSSKSNISSSGHITHITNEHINIKLLYVFAFSILFLLAYIFYTIISAIHKIGTPDRPFYIAMDVKDTIWYK